MPGFFSGILDKLRGSPRTRATFLAAFGKHPGWNDHMDDLGLQSAQLIDLRRLLYVQGISGNIDSGAWESLAPEQRLETFRHLMLWRSGNSLVLARLWSSSDGKGRRKYPMIVAAQADHLPAPWLIDKAGPILERLETEFAATPDAAVVRSGMDRARAELAELALPEPEVPPDDNPGPLATLADRPEMGPDHSKLCILLYHIERELAAFLKGTRSPAGAPRHMRVPACADSPAAAIALWSRFFETQLDPSAMLLLFAPLDGTWIDLIAGEPSPTQFFCVRARPGVVPLATDIPYNLDAAFVAKVEQMLPPRDSSMQ
ncbi:MAG: hypothetical protein ACHRHE_11175 [Tepidisphaerales bacterium]